MTILCAVLCVLLSVALHRHTAGWAWRDKPRFGDAAAAGLTLWAFTFCLLLGGRSLLAGVVCVLLALGLWACNEAKKKALRGEPLVFSDVSLLVQACRFPSLYLPFLPVGRMLAGLAAGLVLGWLLWQQQAHYPSATLWWALWGALAAPLAVALWLRSVWGTALGEWLHGLWPLYFDAREDARAYGPLGAALLHTCWHLSLRGNWGMGVIHTRHSPHPAQGWRRGLLLAPAGHVRFPRPPDIFLVQAESFCDPRGLPHVPDGLLRAYDTVCREAVHGALQVRAFGAYTMRTEFSVLTGVGPEALGTDSFNPYLAASRRPLWSLARHLRDRGYRTLCVHPFDPRFFLRHKVMPHLGFERFLTRDAFTHAQTFGPYIADACVARTMLDALHADARPLFCFAITMEAHGPWRTGRFSDAEAFALPERAPGLSVEAWRYLAHLEHADAMIATLRDGLRARQHPAVLGWYGDHRPGLSGLSGLSGPAGPSDMSGGAHTPYFVWRSDRPVACRKDLPPERLGEALLEAGR